jgi:hypothetical protein
VLRYEIRLIPNVKLLMALQWRSSTTKRRNAILLQWVLSGFFFTWTGCKILTKTAATVSIAKRRLLMIYETISHCRFVLPFWRNLTLQRHTKNSYFLKGNPGIICQNGLLRLSKLSFIINVFHIPLSLLSNACSIPLFGEEFTARL